MHFLFKCQKYLKKKEKKTKKKKKQKKKQETIRRGCKIFDTQSFENWNTFFKILLHPRFINT